jgi:hypothetical protein
MNRCREEMISQIKKEPYKIWSILVDAGELWCKKHNCDSYERCVEEYERLRHEVHKKLVEFLIGDLK